MSDEQPKKKGILNKILTAVIGLIVILIIVVLIIAMSLGTIVKQGGEVVMKQISKCETTIDSASVNLFTGHVEIKDILIKNPKQDAEDKETSFKTEDFFKLGRINIKLDVSSLTGDEILIDEIAIEAPEITYEKTPLVESNLNVILANIEKSTGSDKKEDETKEEEKAPEGEGKKVIIKRLTCNGTVVNLSSCGFGTDVTIPDVNLENLGKPGEGVTVGYAIAMTFKAIFTNIFAKVGELGKAIVEGGKAAVGAAVEGGKAALETGKAAVESATETGKAAVESAKETGKAAVESGKAAVEGLKGLFKKDK